MRVVYRALLVLYPRAFRKRYAAELLDTFDADRGDPRFRGVLGACRLWHYLLTDLVTSAVRQRLRAVAAAYTERTGHGVPRLPQQPGSSFMESLVQDVRYAVRQFARRPGFTAIAVLSLALGIGGNSLIYGMLDGYVFNPFPYPDAHRLIAIGSTFPKVSSASRYVEAISPAEYNDFRTARSFSAFAAFDLGNRSIAGGDVPERVFTAFLLDDLFPVMGMPAFLGRGFTAEELGPDGPSVAILSHRLWTARFNADPRILERTIRIGGVPHAVVGVMPPGLLLLATDMWMPWGGDPAQVPRTARQFTILGRLAPGVSRSEANAELAVLAGRVQQAHSGTFKEYEGWRLEATPWAAALFRDLRPAAFVLLVAVGLVLLIACANLANLMLARATTRARELAVRLALGAGRWRVARLLLTESLLLASAGAAVGIALAYATLPFAGALVPPQFRSLGLDLGVGAGVNLRVLAWSTGAALAAGLIVAVLPMLQAVRTDPHESLKSEARAGASRGAARMRHGLVVAEIALSVVLLLGAALLMRSVLNVQDANLGYDPRGVLAMRTTLPQQKYPTWEAVTTFFEQLTARTAAVPGVTASAMTSRVPPAGAGNTRIEVEGMPATGETLSRAGVTVASRNYFKTVGVPILRGRLFDATDTPEAPDRVIVNEAFVRQFLNGRDPLTTRVRTAEPTEEGPWAEIIGVVRDARNQGATAPVAPEMFTSVEQGRHGWNQLYLLVRTDGDPGALLPQVRQVVAALDPEQPVYAVQTLEEALAVSTFQRWIAMVLLGGFAAVALAMSAVGIYGVMSYAVSARTQEIGVRMAIGAQRSDVVSLVLRQVAALATIGLAIGVTLLLLAGKALSGLLYGVTPWDPLTIALVALTLGAVSLLAGWVPARKASRISPIQALRYE